MSIIAAASPAVPLALFAEIPMTTAMTNPRSILISVLLALFMSAPFIAIRIDSIHTPAFDLARERTAWTAANQVFHFSSGPANRFASSVEPFMNLILIQTNSFLQH